jgi:hypothetical protein
MIDKFEQGKFYYSSNILIFVASVDLDIHIKIMAAVTGGPIFGDGSVHFPKNYIFGEIYKDYYLEDEKNLPLYIGWKWLASEFSETLNEL